MPSILRSSGLLAPIFSLPGVRDLGSLGAPTRDFVDFLVKAKQTWFQITPVNPIDEFHSPYAGRSAFAGEVLFLDLEDFRRAGLLDEEDLDRAWRLPKRLEIGDSSDPQEDRRSERVDYARALERRRPMWEKAFERYEARQGGERYRAQEEEFVSQNAEWLDDYLLFTTACDAFKTCEWSEWPVEIRRRDPQALAIFAREHERDLRFHRFLQLAFDVQWKDLKRHCDERGVKIFGDAPIYVGKNSADVWAFPELFMIDGDGNLLREAGVPADGFNSEGQPWSSPTYRWSAHRATDYAWWKRRALKTLERFDLVRLDHFIGFYNYFSFERGENDAPWQEERRKAFDASPKDATYEEGWTPGPQESFFDALFSVCPKEAFVAEDLGVMNPGVHALRDRYDLPGMDVLQFSFDHVKIDPTRGSAPNPLLVWKENHVAYTGTHDAETILGWLENVRKYGGKVQEYESVDFKAIASVLKRYERRGDAKARAPFAPLRRLGNKLRELLRSDAPEKSVSTRYVPLARKVEALRTATLRAVFASPCKIVIFPLQDVLGLANDARVNFPGVPTGNWTWRIADGALDEEAATLLSELSEETGRTPNGSAT